MTLIIGSRDGWMVSDRRTTFGSELIPVQTNKILKVNNCLIGIAGEGGLVSEAENWLWVHPGDTAEPLAQWLVEKKRDCQVLVVTAFGGLSFVTANGAIYHLRPEQKWWSIGSSRDIGNAWLTASVQWKMALNGNDVAETSDAIDAITYAVTVDSHVGDGIQIETLAKAEK